MKTGRKHYNLVYRRLYWQFTPICITLFVVCMTGYLARPDDPTFGGLLAGAGILFLLAGIVALSYAVSAYAQCRKKVLRLRYPLRTFEIPYENIESARLTTVERLLIEQTEADKKRKPGWSERMFLDPVMTREVIVLQLRKMPGPHAWLRLWIGRRWLGQSSLALVVGDWLLLRRQIDEHIAASRTDLHSRLAPRV